MTTTATDHHGVATDEVAGSRARMARLAAAVDEVVAGGLDGLDEPALKAELAALETERRRLSARQTTLVATLARRRAAAGARPGRGHEAERTSRDLQRELTGDLGWTPGEAKGANRLGRQLGDQPEVADAYRDGQLPARNAQLLADTLDKLPADRREQARDRLLEPARRQDAVTFGRTCRTVLAELDHDAAMRDEHRRHDARGATVTQRPDGMTVVSGRWAGLDGELVHTAIHAFRTPDVPGEARTPEQRTADAIVEALRVALRHADAPATHGIRPHVTVTVPYETVATGAGAGQAAWTGPIPYGELRRLLDDAGIARILVDAEGLPLEASAEVRTVPAGLYRFLLVRDGGCIAQGCDAPAAWCDVMHLDHPYRLDGRLSPDNAALGCRRHHRAYDLHGWRLTWHENRPLLRPPPRRSSAGP